MVPYFAKMNNRRHIMSCNSDTAGSKYLHRRSDYTIWHASVGYVGDIVGETAGDFDGRSFSVGFTAFETIDHPLWQSQ